MLNKSRPQGATDGGRRRYDLPGASLRGPYKLWIPQTDNRQSESETEGPRPVPSSSHRPHGHHGSTTHVAAGNTATTSASNARHTNMATAQHAAPAPQKQRTERTPLGYSSEASVHAPANSSKTSAFSLFRPHVKETRREELPRSTTAPAAVPSSRHTTSQPVNVPPKSVSRNAPLQGAVFGSLSTQTSTDPSPRSSTDSGPRNGHASAPAAENSETRKQHSTWNPYVDARIDRTATSRKNETISLPPRREEKRPKDKEDMVARVTEALGGGSTGKAKAAENALLHNQTSRRDDGGATRRTTSSSATRGAEGQSYAQSRPQPSGSTNTQHYAQTQTIPTLRRHKTTPQSTPLPVPTHLPDNASKNSRPSTSSRGHAEASSRSHGPPEPPSKVLSSNTRIPTSSASKVPHQRTASSPWPFNQALPPEPLVAPTKPQTPQAHSSSWKQPFSRFQGSTSQKTPDTHTKESTLHPPSHAPAGDVGRNASQAYSSSPAPHPPSHAPAGDFGRNASQAYTPSPAPRRQSSRSSLLPSSQPSHIPTTSTPPRPVPPPAAAPAPPPSTQTRTNPSYATTSIEPQRWSPNALTPGRPATGPTGGPQSYSTSQVPTMSKYPETTNAHLLTPEPAPSGTGKRYLTSGAQPNATGPPGPTAPQRSVTASNAGLQSHSTSRSPWPATSRYPEAGADISVAPEPASVVNGRYLTPSAPPSMDAPIQAAGRSATASTPNPLWSTTSRYPEIASAAPAPAEPTPASGRNVGHDSLTTPAAGTWTSKYTADNYPSSGYETDDTPKESTAVPALQASHAASGYAESPPRQANGTSTPEKLAPGAWTSRYAAGNMSASTFEVIPIPKPPPKAPGGEGPTSTALKYASATDPTARSLRYAAANTVPASQPAATAPGAWTTSTRYATNTSGSIFDSTPTTKGPNGSPRETSGSTRQATLGTTPVAGAWTTKQTPGSGTPSSSESTLKQTPINNNTLAPPSLLKPPLASGTNTGTSTPSSTQISDLLNPLSPVTSHSIATRVPISGHPSTPAPVRPVLRATPPPLSISSTSPDTDSLLTPSSLNSPRSTIALPQPQPVSTITAADVPQPPEKETIPRKNGFFDFFRPKPPLKSYEVWTPPTRSRDKERTGEEQPKAPAPSPPKPKATAPVPVPVPPPPRPKSPKIFSPFKLFSKRHRTVSSASLDVLDGTAPNTVLNSPASSMRADTPGAPPSPPLRDAILATQEWRNKEATELVVSGRKRRHRPGVTFDCPEDTAPIDILPSRLRIGRMHGDDDD